MIDGSCTLAFTKAMAGGGGTPPDEDEEEEDDDDEADGLPPALPPLPPPQAIITRELNMQKARIAADLLMAARLPQRAAATNAETM
jgi:hypothetical protein